MHVLERHACACGMPCVSAYAHAHMCVNMCRSSVHGECVAAMCEQMICICECREHTICMYALHTYL